MHEADPILIIGAGLSGLTAAMFLGERCIVVEREDTAGGLCRSERVDGWSFDYGGHVLHFDGRGRGAFLRPLLGDAVHEHVRDAWVHTNGIETPYPFQAHLHGLPDNVVSECVSGLEAAHRNGVPTGPTKNLEEWFMSRCGEGLTRHFLTPYNHKLWTVPPSELSSQWAERFIPVPSLSEVRAGAEGRQDKTFGYNTSFCYPVGGMGSLPRALLPHVSDLRLGIGVQRVDLEQKRLLLDDGASMAYGTLITTAPLPSFVRMLSPAPPAPIRTAAQRLRHMSVYCLNLGVQRAHVTDKHWIYYPDADTVFYRVGCTSNLAPGLSPEGMSSLCVEVSYSEHRPLNRSTIRDRIVRDLVKVGLLETADEVVVECPLDIEVAYSILDHHHEASVAAILDYLRSQHIFSIGRYGSWQYMSVSDVAEEARALSEQLRGQA